jgi:hypothetical protein
LPPAGVKRLEGLEQLVVGRRLVPPHPLPFDAGVERKARFGFGGIGRCTLAMLMAELLESRHGLRDDLEEGVSGVRRAGARALREPFLEDQVAVLVGDLVEPVQVHGVTRFVAPLPGDPHRAPLAFEGVAQRQDGIDDGVALHLQGLHAQQAEGLEALKPGPGLARADVFTKLIPAVEQPVGAFERGFELEDEGGGMIGIGGQCRTAKRAGRELPGQLILDVLDVGIPGVNEEPAAQAGDLGLAAHGLGGGYVADIGSDARGLGAIAAFGLPAGGKRALDQGELDVVAWLEAGRLRLEALLKYPGVLAGQDHGLGSEAMLQTV